MNKEIEELANRIIKYKRLYYAGKPEVSDVDYDKLEEKLRRIAPHHPALEVIGGELSTNLPKVQHSTPMLSLAKTYDLKELLTWAEGEALIGTIKVDGTSLSLIYIQGELTQAKTRGNGKVGEDVTPKIRWIGDCYPEISEKQSLEIRGELYCTEDNFGHLAGEMNELGLDAPTSPRNIVAGVLGRKQHIELARFFNFLAFDALSLTGKELFKTEEEKFAWLKQHGFTLPKWAKLTTPENIEEFLDQTKTYLTEGNIGIDGAVFTYNDCTKHAELGHTSHHPRYKLSFKWQGNTEKTKIKEIQWATSRLGIVTPVAVVEPVVLSGATITNVTLHNASYVVNFKLKPGDTIEIVRSGEVIPKFLQVIESSSGSHEIPKKCPSCNAALTFDEVRLVCQNHQHCSAQQIGTILNWIRCAQIDDLSEKRLWPLIELELVKHMSDLYQLTVDDFLKLPLTKDKMAQKLWMNIQRTKQLPLAQFLNGLGIPNAGLTTWESITEIYPSLEKIQALTVDDLCEIDGFAQNMATQIVEGLARKRRDIKSLLAVGVTPLVAEKKTTSGKLSGKTFVLTGAMSIPRQDWAKIIMDLGGHVSESISKNTYALVSSDPNSKSGKSVKAKKLGVTILSEEDLKLLTQ